MALSNAERQARWRARHRPEVAAEQPDPTVARLRAHVEFLEGEVRRLGAELNTVPNPFDRPFNSRPFTPVPKSARVPAVPRGSSRSPSRTFGRGHAG
jgi:hypothetical protein